MRKKIKCNLASPLGTYQDFEHFRIPLGHIPARLRRLLLLLLLPILWFRIGITRTTAVVFTIHMTLHILMLNLHGDLLNSLLLLITAFLSFNGDDECKP